MVLPIINATGVIVKEPSTFGVVDAVFNISLDHASTVPVNFTAYTMNETASESDYKDLATTYTIPPGVTVFTVAVRVNGDQLVEGNEAFSLILTGASGATFAGGAAALELSGTIIDVGQPQQAGVGAVATPLFGPASATSSGAPTIRVSNVSGIETADPGYGSHMRFLVTLDKAATVPVSIDFATYDGSARDGYDYLGGSGTLTIPAGQLSGFITVGDHRDSIAEGDESLQLVINNPVNGVFERGAVALVATGTILDDDNGAVTGPATIGSPALALAGASAASSTLPTMSVQNVTAYEPTRYAFDKVNFLVTLDKPAASLITVEYSIQDGTATGDRASSSLGATDGADFLQSTGTLTFAPGDQTAFIPVTTLGDGKAELNETFKLVLTNVRGAAFAQGAAALVATGTLIDTDGGAAGAVAAFGGSPSAVFAPTDIAAAPPVLRVISTSVNEGQERAGIFLILSHAPTASVVVHVNTADGTATAGSGDYFGLNSDVTIAAGTVSSFFPISVNADSKIEGDETFTVNFTALTGATFEAGGTVATASVLIRDDDGGGSAGTVTGGPQFSTASALAPIVSEILRTDGVTGSTGTLATNLSNQLSNGQITLTAAHRAIVDAAINTSSVATLSYQFFTGKTPGNNGMDYLVSPNGPNPNNLNAAYYQSFSLENRYINFAVNLGKVGEGNAAFTAKYGALSLFEATRSAYATIFGEAPSDLKLHAILDPSTILNGISYTRAEYFAYYGQDGANGIGTKAAMVGFLLAEAEKADVGVYARSNDALLTDIALHGVSFGVDLVGVYSQPSFIFHPN